MSDEDFGGTPAEDEVRALYAALLDAWNRRDAAGYAKLFVPDGCAVGFDGSQMAAGEIEATLGAIFAEHPTAGYVAQVREVRELGRRAALLRAVAGMVPPAGGPVNPAVNAVHAMVAQQRDGEWRIVLFQNTPAQYHGRPDLVEQHTAEIQRLVDAAGH